VVGNPRGKPNQGKARRPAKPERPPRIEDEDEKREHEFEFDLLRQHEEQFDPQRWLQGMSQKRQMPQATLETIDPGPAVLKKRDEPAVDVRPGSNVILVCAHNDSAAGAGNRLMMTTEGDREPTRQPDGTVVNQPSWSAVIDNGSDPMVSVAFARSEPAKAYAISQSGRLYRKDDIDAGGAWSQPGQSPVGDVRQLAVNSRHSGHLYAVTGYNVFRSVDSGASWAHVGAGSVPLSEFNSIVADPGSATRVYLGTDIGVFVSDDEGDTWHPFDVALPNAEVLQIFVSGSYLYAVTHGRGLWRRRLC